MVFAVVCQRSATRYVCRFYADGEQSHLVLGRMRCAGDGGPNMSMSSASIAERSGPALSWHAVM